jgi:uncharacterized membrane protein YqaE (UPF0057 family)
VFCCLQHLHSVCGLLFPMLSVWNYGMVQYSMFSWVFIRQVQKCILYALNPTKGKLNLDFWIMKEFSCLYIKGLIHVRYIVAWYAWLRIDGFLRFVLYLTTTSTVYECHRCKWDFQPDAKTVDRRGDCSPWILDSK